MSRSAITPNGRTRRKGGMVRISTIKSEVAAVRNGRSEASSRQSDAKYSEKPQSAFACLRIRRLPRSNIHSGIKTMRAAMFLTCSCFLIGCGNRGDDWTSQKKIEPTKEASIPEAEPKKALPKPKELQKYAQQLALEVPNDIAAFKKSKYKSKVISYEPHPRDETIFLALTIEIKPAYLTDDVITPKWFTKAVFISSLQPRSGSKPTTVDGIISQTWAAALNAGDNGWGRVEFLP